MKQSSDSHSASSNLPSSICSSSTSSGSYPHQFPSQYWNWILEPSFHMGQMRWHMRWQLWQLWLQQIYARTHVEQGSLLFTSTLIFVKDETWHIYQTRKLFSGSWLYIYFFPPGKFIASITIQKEHLYFTDIVVASNTLRDNTIYS